MHLTDRLFTISDVRIQCRTTNNKTVWIEFDGVKQAKRFRNFLKEYISSRSLTSDKPTMIAPPLEG
jgi:hypothetical protein